MAFRLAPAPVLAIMPRMYYGCAWYPEHWPASRWPEDLRLMKAAGMNVVRMGEFAWSRLEPSEGQFCFDWLADAVDLAASFGLRSVLGTPTASPPAWLTQQHPEVLRTNPNGTPAIHGGRGHFSPSSETYLTYCRRIAEAMARRFGQHPHVIGWQIDNEYWPFSYDPETRRQFQDFLRQRYGTLENLNARWSNVYWSQDYSDWSQVPLSTDWQNPCLVHAFRLFFTRVYGRYQHNQLEPIRAWAGKDQFITHNFHGWFEHGDPFVLCRELDFASVDPYVGSGHLDPYAMGFKLDLVRGFKRQNFWTMETQPGFVNWSPLNNALDRGETRAMCFHQVAHGADAVLFWQWRSALGGQEQYHGSILNQSGEPRPIYPEIAQTGRELAAAAEVLRDTVPASQVALLWNFDDRWAVNAQKHHKDFDAVGHALAYYRPLRRAGYDVEVLHPKADLAGHTLAIAPHLHLLDEERVAHLLAFARGGGHLLLGARSGMKDAHNALLAHAQPGPSLSEALGAHVHEFYALEAPIPVSGTLPGGQEVRGTASIFAEWLEVDAPDAQVLLRYAGHSWLENQPALVTRPLGRGRISYLAAWLDEPAMAALLAFFLPQAPPLAGLPEGVEVSRRRGRGQDLTILINHTRHPQTVALPRAMHDVLANAPRGPQLTLAPRDVALLSTPSAAWGT